MNWHILFEGMTDVSDYTVITVRNKFIITCAIYFPVFSRKGFKKPQEVQGPKCKPHFSVTDIRISLLFGENAIYSVLEQLIRCFEPSNFFSPICNLFPFVFSFYMYVTYFGPYNNQNCRKLLRTIIGPVTSLQSIVILID